ncbi:hypothetical protein FHX46_000968 [Amycolatopsis viridis]|uniref:Uncharacterized protein n=1 Tax=Amycolatopsis viridis TaxID=185678 RepID=A0ABX0SN96_9PSEU|nr:hypothetical protein [Amycolatopsis viridis]
MELLLLSPDVLDELDEEVDFDDDDDDDEDDDRESVR